MGLAEISFLEFKLCAILVGCTSRFAQGSERGNRVRAFCSELCGGFPGSCGLAANQFIVPHRFAADDKCWQHEYLESRNRHQILSVVRLLGGATETITGLSNFGYPKRSSLDSLSPKRRSLRLNRKARRLGLSTVMRAVIWEFPKIRGTFFWGPYTKDPTI